MDTELDAYPSCVKTFDLLMQYVVLMQYVAVHAYIATCLCSSGGLGAGYSTIVS